MKVTEEFVCEIKKLQYLSFENKSKYSTEEDKMLYVCSANVKEVCRGSKKNKERHNVVFYISKEEFETKDNEIGERVFDVGDRIRILAGTKWHCTHFEFKSFKKDVVAKMDVSKLKYEPTTNQTYYTEKAYCYKLICKKENWKMESKFFEQNYCTIKGSRIKLPLSEKSDFETKTEFNWYLDAKESRIIKEYVGSTCSVIAYSNGSKVGDRQMLVELYYDEEAQTNNLVLSGAQ